MAFRAPGGWYSGTQGNSSLQLYGSQAEALAAEQPRAGAGLSNPYAGPVITPTVTTADRLKSTHESMWGETADERATRNTARSAIQNYQFQDLASVYDELLNSSGLKGLSSQISSLMGEAGRLQGIYRDVPDTILRGARDEGIIKKQLELQTANAREPLYRSISDLLSSVSVLSDEYQRGQQGIQFQLGLKQQQEQQQYQGLLGAYNFAQEDLSSEEGRVNSLVSSIADQIRQEEQNRYSAEQSLLSRQQDESQFARSLAQDESQFARQLAKPSGGGSTSGEPTTAQLRAADELVFSYGLNPTKLTEQQQIAFSTAITYYPNDRAKQDEYLKRVGITPATTSQGGGALSRYAAAGNPLAKFFARIGDVAGNRRQGLFYNRK